MKDSSVWRSIEFFVLMIVGAVGIGLLCVAVA
jgi:hypothetical protein